MPAKLLSQSQRESLQAGSTLPVKIVGEDRIGYKVSLIPKEHKPKERKIDPNTPLKIYSYDPPKVKRDNSVESFFLEQREKLLLEQNINPYEHKREFFEVDLTGKSPTFKPIEELNKQEPIYVKKGTEAITKSRYSPEKFLKDAKVRDTQPSHDKNVVDNKNNVTDTFDKLFLNNLKTGMRLEGIVAHSTPYNSFVSCKVYRRGKGGKVSEINGLLAKEDIPKDILKVSKKEQQMMMEKENIPLNEFKIPLLQKGLPFTVYVKEVSKQQGRFTVTLDPSMTKSKLYDMKKKKQEDGILRRRQRRLKRQLDEVYAGDILTGYVHKIIAEGILLNVTSLGSLNVTGIILMKDLPKEFQVPNKLYFEGKQELLNMDFPVHQAVECYVDKINPLPNPLLEYNMGLTFRAFSKKKNIHNLKYLDEDQEEIDEEESSSQKQDIQSEMLDDEELKEFRNVKTFDSKEDLRAWRSKIREKEAERQKVELGRLSQNEYDDEEEANDEKDEADNYDSANDSDSGTDYDDEDDVGIDASELNEEDYIDEEVSEIYDALRGDKQYLNIDDVFDWDDIQDKFEAKLLSPQSIIKAVQRLKITDPSQISKVQFSDLVLHLQDEVEKNEEKMTKKPDSPNNKSKKSEERNVSKQLKESRKIETERKTTEKEKASTTTKNDFIEENRDAVDENEILQNITDEEIERNAKKNEKLYDQFLNSYNPSKPTMSEDELIDSSTDEVIREIYDELRGNAEVLTISKFRNWSDIDDLYKLNRLNDSFLSSCYKEVGINFPKVQTIAYKQFRSLVELLESKLNSEEDGEGAEEEEEGETNREKELNKRNDQEGEDEISVVQEIYDDLKKKDGRVTLKTVYEWDDVKDAISNQFITKEQTLEIFRKVTKKKFASNKLETVEISAEEFSEILLALDELAGEESEEEIANILQNENSANDKLSPSKVNNLPKTIKEDFSKASESKSIPNSAPHEDENTLPDKLHFDDAEMQEMNKDMFNEISKDGGKSITIQALLASTEIRDLLSENYISEEKVLEFVRQVTNGGKAQKSLTFEQFLQFMKLLDSHLDQFIPHENDINISTVRFEKDDTGSILPVEVPLEKVKEEVNKKELKSKPENSTAQSNSNLKLSSDFKTSAVKDFSFKLPTNATSYLSDEEEIPAGFEHCTDQDFDEDDYLEEEDYQKEFDLLRGDVSKFVHTFVFVSFMRITERGFTYQIFAGMGGYT
jgi:hypothetical protein